MYEFVQELLVHPSRPPDIFTLLPFPWDALLLSSEEVIFQYQPVFFGSSSLKCSIPWSFTKKIPDEAKVCVSEDQGRELAVCPLC